MWGISITMCYFHRFIDDINYSLQDFLITFGNYIQSYSLKPLKGCKFAK